MRRLVSGCLMLALSGAGPITASAQSVTGALKKAGQATEEAGKQAGEAAKDVGKATVETTKKGVDKAKTAVTGEEARAICTDGTKQMGKTRADAAARCANHGGVAKR